MFYTIYKITNRINNKIYVGKHQTQDLNDNYLGSGKILKRAIEKYGLENFEKEYLYIFDEKEDMDGMEKEIVSEEFVQRLDTYNLKVGGEGGWDYINNNVELRKEKNNRAAVKMNEVIWADEEFVKKMAKINGDRLREIHRSGNFKHYGNWLGKKHTEETKKKIGKANSEHQMGKGNSRYGTCWIYNEELQESKSIKTEELNDWLSKGWIKGRKIKFV